MKNTIITIFVFSCFFISGHTILNESKCDGDDFDGKTRREAKLTIGTGHIESEISVQEFLNTFNGTRSLDDNSSRNGEEQRNVKVTGWLYTYAREGDEDFHLILGDSQNGNPKLMSAEISGLPKATEASYHKLLNARNQFKHIILGDANYCSGFTKKLLK